MTKKVINVEAGTIEFQFDDGSKQTFEMSKINAEIQSRLAFHGASQKIGDSYAGASDSADPVGYAKEAVKDTIAQLYAGDWRVTVSGGPRTSDLSTALAKISGRSVEECSARVATLSDEQKKELRKNPQVAAVLAGLAAQKALAKAEKAAEAAAKAPALQF